MGDPRVRPGVVAWEVGGNGEDQVGSRRIEQAKGQEQRAVAGNPRRMLGVVNKRVV